MRRALLGLASGAVLMLLVAYGAGLVRFARQTVPPPIRPVPAWTYHPCAKRLFGVTAEEILRREGRPDEARRAVIPTEEYEAWTLERCQAYVENERRALGRDAPRLQHHAPTTSSRTRSA